MARQQTAEQAELLRQLKSSPETGMAMLWDRYSNLVRAAVRPYLSSPEDQEECVNDTFLAFFLQKDRFDPKKGDLSDYLTGIARKTAVSRYRTSPAWALPLSEEMPDPADLILNVENRMDLERAMEVLSPENAKMIRERYFDGLTVEEIARRRNLSYESVKKRHQRSLQKLRVVLLGGLIALAILLLGACAVTLLIRMGLIPGRGITTEPENPAYQQAGPVQQEDEFGVYTVQDALYKDHRFSFVVDLDLKADPGDRTGDELNAWAMETLPFYQEERGEAEWIAWGKDGFSTKVMCAVLQKGNLLHWTYFIEADHASPPEEDGKVRLKLNGTEITIPMEAHEAEPLEEYHYTLGDYGGLLAVPKVQEGELEVELYALNHDSPRLSEKLTSDFLEEVQCGHVVLTGEDGTEMEGQRTGEQMYFTTDDTLTRWSFGAVPPGNYTIRVTDPVLVEEVFLSEGAILPLNLETLEWDKSQQDIPYGRIAISDIEEVGAGDIEEKPEWRITAEWEPDSDLDLIDLPLSIYTPYLNDEGNDSVTHGSEDRDGDSFYFHYRVEEGVPDLTASRIMLSGVFSYRWPTVLEIPITVSSEANGEDN